LNELEKLNTAVSLITQKIKKKPEIAIILGSGLGVIAEKIKDPVEIPYETIPGFPISTVKGHEGKLIFGTLESKPVCLFKGRFHYYEGYSLREVTFPIRVVGKLDVKILIVTNAAGGVNPYFEPGDIMIIRDHINLLPDNPLRGPNLDKFGPRFPSMHDAYSKKLIKLTHEVASKAGISVKEGVYVALQGPSLETPAEYRFVNLIGGDVVGMSTVPEVIVARHMGIEVLGFSIITNVADPYNPKPTTHEEVIQVGEKSGKILGRLIEEILRNM